MSSNDLSLGFQAEQTGTKRAGAAHAFLVLALASVVSSCTSSSGNAKSNPGVAQGGVCSTTTECAAPANPCELAVCVGGTCRSATAPEGLNVPASVQVKGDCKKLTCDASGRFATSADPSDVPLDDRDPCTAEACDGPNPVRRAVPGCRLDAGATGDPTAPPAGGGRSDKVDLLFAIDNSPSMSDKQAILGIAVPRIVGRIVSPLCRKNFGVGDAVGQSTAGDCSTFVSAYANDNVALEFPAIKDLHVGIVSSSLGARGGYAACKPRDPAQFPFQRHTDDRGRLVNRTKATAGVATDGAPDDKATANGGFLSFYTKDQLPGGARSPDASVIRDPAELVARFARMVTGVQEYGCGFEAQLESAYRFLFQPDPYANTKVSVDTSTGAESIALESVDEQVLSQRKKFLRPDSVVAVVMVTDENDSTGDPLSVEAVSGVGYQWGYWFFDYGYSADPPQVAPLRNNRGYTPRGTSACDASPMSPACVSCRANPNDSACTGATGNRVPDGDSPNVRWFQPKRRFGFDPRFPIDRYANAFRSVRVPNRNTEHGASGQYRLDPAANNCTNPVFAAALPDGAIVNNPGAIDGALCDLPLGTRSRDMVVFSLLGGVPWQLLTTDANPATASYKATLSSSDWVRVLGADSTRYDFSGADAHMLESLVPRPGLPGPTTAGNGTDPVHGREYNTLNADLQYACTFTLPTPKACGASDFCDCNTVDKNPPLCSGAQQVKGKAYPSVRELEVARALASTDQSVVGSICPLTLTGSADDPRYGYNPFATALVNRIARQFR